MIRRASLSWLILLVLLATACTPAAAPAPKKSGLGEVSVSPMDTPKPGNFSAVTQRPLDLKAPATPDDPWAVDLRHRDLTGQDLTQAGEVLLKYGTFDTATKWPANLPAGFDPQRILELGKDPGLGIRELHKQGITGQGVRVAFLDQDLLVEHEEYKGSMAAYRQLDTPGELAQMHGSAVASILTGKSLGVAPEAALTYYAVQHLKDGAVTWENHAKAIHEILDQNMDLPAAQRIRVIGVSLGYSANWSGYNAIKEAVARAKAEGVLVLTTSPGQDYAFDFTGLDREPLGDPNDLAAYRPGNWWAEEFYKQPTRFAKLLMVPMDSRTTAGPGGTAEYTYYRMGGLSWVVPYLVGMYALGVQVKPDLTPDQFFRAALKSASYTDITHDGKGYRLGPILNPAALIDELR